MKLLSGFLLLISGHFLTVTTACSQDNCARAVNGSRKGLDFQFSAKQNCSSFLKVTVHPATIMPTRTTTTTTAITGTTTLTTDILKNFQFTPVGGCQEEPAPTDEILWAYNAFNAPLILDVQPRMVGVRRGYTAVLTITDGPTGWPVPGALFAGVLSDANGKVVFTASQVGTFKYKATRGDAIRSPAMVITVTK